MVVELPEGTFTAGDRGTSTPTGVSLTPPSFCSNEFYPGTNWIRVYRCRIDFHPAHYTQDLGGPMFLFAVTTEGHKNRKFTVTLEPVNFSDVNMKNNSITTKISVP
jgi:hypothetical protein